MNSSLTNTSSDIQSIESLTAEQQQLVKRFVKQSGQPGAIVGVLRGKATWDIRPVFMNNGQLEICRLTDPALSLDGNMFQGFCDLNRTLSQIGKIDSFGQFEGQAWVRRPFYSDTLKSISLDSLHIHPLKFVRRLIKFVADLNKQKIYHGHITTSNITLIDNNPKLIDYGFRAWSANSYEKTNSVAPELYKKFPPTPATDVYGLGHVMLTMLGNVLSREHLSIVQAMCSESVEARPTLDLVTNEFLPAGNLSQKVQIAKRPFRPNELRSGKLISPTLIKRPQTVLEPEIKQQVEKPKIIEPTQQRVEPEVVHTPAPEPPPVRQPVSPAPQPVKQSGGGFFWFIAIPVIAALIWYAKENEIIEYWLEPKEQNGIDYKALWDSGQKNLMSTVAKKAVKKPKSSAAEAIISSIDSLTDEKDIQVDLLKTAFHPAWKNELTKADRQAALTLGLAPLLSGASLNLPQFKDLHPGVLLAIAGALPLNQKNDQLDAIPLSQLTELPDEYGISFQLLEDTGVKVLRYPVAKALCHLVVGDSNPKVIQTFFGSTSNQNDMAQKVVSLVPILDINPNLAENLATYLESSGENALSTFTWFSSKDSTLADWKNVNPAEKLRLSVGADIQTVLGYEQLIDLLSYPLLSVRRKAERQLAVTVPEELFPIVGVLGSEENKLTREQSISLMAALRLKVESQHPFIEAWFNTNPDVNTVVKLLIGRRGIEGFDPFSLEASRYIKDKEWELPLTQLEKLLVHSEALVRALVYRKLDPTKPEELELLKGMSTVEPDKNIRELIRRKVEDFEETEATNEG